MGDLRARLRRSRVRRRLVVLDRRRRLQLRHRRLPPLPPRNICIYRGFDVQLRSEGGHRLLALWGRGVEAETLAFHCTCGIRLSGCISRPTDTRFTCYDRAFSVDRNCRRLAVCVRVDKVSSLSGL